MSENRDSEVERCEYIHIHEDIVEQVNQNMPDEEILYDLAELFKIFGDSPVSRSCTSSLSRRCASATSPSFWA